MRLCVAALLLAELVSCAHSEQPTRGASQPGASAAARPAVAMPQTSAAAPVVDAASRPSSSSAQLSPATSGGLAELSVSNRDGLRGLVAALKDVERVELVRWDQRAKAEPLAAADQTRLLQLIGGGQLTETHTVAHPPWPAAFVFHTRSHGTYAATVVGRSSLRLDAGRADGHFEGAAARWNGSPPPDLALNSEEDWLWAYFESHLGPTREKEYLMPKAPDYLELPKKP
ncbi:MAG: hypothetical protein ABJB12_02330 [Pseudomonadota bacterium]